MSSTHLRRQTLSRLSIDRTFRNYHRWLAIAFAIPLLTTVLSGVIFSIVVETLHQRQWARLLLGIHTWEIIGLGHVFPLINGLGLMGLLATGVYMITLRRQRR